MKKLIRVFLSFFRFLFHIAHQSTCGSEVRWKEVKQERHLKVTKKGAKNKPSERKIL